MKKHLLLEKAFHYPPSKTINDISDCNYNNINGYWAFQGTDKPIVNDSRFKKPMSKKADRETGEDQKGE